MSLAEAQMNPVERRRSERSPLGLPVDVRGTSLDMRPFQEGTVTRSVSAHGALVELATTVTLGQTLFLRNRQTQDEAQAWVARLGTPRGAGAQVGVEFVRPHQDFWSVEPPTEARIEGTDEGTDRYENAVPEQASYNDGKEDPLAEQAPPHSHAASGTTLPDILLRALDQTLQQAAERVIAAATNSRLIATVNQAAESIENVSRAKVRQLEERMEQYRQEVVASAVGEVLSQIKSDVEQTQEQLRSRAAELLEEGARAAQDDFAERLSEKAHQAAVQFGEEAAASSAQHLANLTERAQVSINEAQTEIDGAFAALSKSHEGVKAETGRAVIEAQQRVELLASQSKEVYAEWEIRLQQFRDELTRSADQESERFREHLQSVLTSLLSSLRL
jgi:hypothetical protein